MYPVHSVTHNGEELLPSGLLKHDPLLGIQPHLRQELYIHKHGGMSLPPHKLGILSLKILPYLLVLINTHCQILEIGSKSKENLGKEKVQV